LRAEKVEQVGKKAFRQRAEELGTRWHRDFAPRLRAGSALSNEVLDLYNSGFTRLIKLSAPNNSRKGYFDAIDSLVRPFRDDLIIPAQQGVLEKAPPSAFNSFFTSLSNQDENEYLSEAIACAQAGYLRAAAVLGWSAAIDRIHRKIEAIGIGNFNVTSAQMASQKIGRFKRFNQVQNISSLSELREVFDNIMRGWWGNPCGFKSRLRHHRNT